MGTLLKRFLSDDSGATAIEYGLIVALISVVGIGVMGEMGDSLVAIFGIVETTLSSAAAG